MRGLTDGEREILQELLEDPNAPFVDQHTQGVPYTAKQLEMCKTLFAQGRITAYTCRACGHIHPVLTSLGKDALTLDKFTR